MFVHHPTDEILHKELPGFKVSVREYAVVPGKGCIMISVPGRGKVKLHSSLSPLQNTIFTMVCNTGKENLSTIWYALL